MKQQIISTFTGTKTISETLQFVKIRCEQCIKETSSSSSMSQSYFRIFDKLSIIKQPKDIFTLSLLQDDCIKIQDNPVIPDLIQFLNDEITNIQIIPSHIVRFSKNEKSKLKHKSKSKQHSEATSNANLNLKKLTTAEQIYMKWKDKTVKFICLFFYFCFSFFMI